ncbi:MAG: phosphomannomutase, partial [Mycobacterium sp.]|nr:phosphomannomutase [Mycobacterium sp.]
MADPSLPPLTFGTAGLRGPMRDGPAGMNVETVTRASWALAKVLKDRSLGGSTVVVGRDARHQSDDFAMATAEVLAAEGFSVVLLPDA